jgi:DNA-binding NarL/FixJ family response regulator
VTLILFVMVEVQLELLGTVAVVEDEPMIRLGMCETLRKAGWDVCGFANGEDAMAALTRPGRPFPDVLVVDEGLPRTSGSSLLQLLCRAGFRGGRVLVSGLPPDLIGPRAVEIADEYVVKSRDLKIELPVAVSLACARGRQRADWGAGTVPRRAPLAAPGRLSDRIFGELDRAGKLAPRMREALGHRLEGLSVEDTAAIMGVGRRYVSHLCKEACDLLGADNVHDVYRLLARRCLSA